ncbi:probable serine/threonine-protein kinase clkA, partial [Piliocolobus tephrosceles]|uniref:probable serine/threonine-protein kinase clkA n=1 Tax=Piliocolobus tephrosceles TaxID=591936 RepID=UPI000E6B36BC
MIFFLSVNKCFKLFMIRTYNILLYKIKEQEITMLYLFLYIQNICLKKLKYYQSKTFYKWFETNLYYFMTDHTFLDNKHYIINESMKSTYNYKQNTKNDLNKKLNYTFYFLVNAYNYQEIVTMINNSGEEKYEKGSSGTKNDEKGNDGKGNDGKGNDGKGNDGKKSNDRSEFILTKNVINNLFSNKDVLYNTKGYTNYWNNISKSAKSGLITNISSSIVKTDHIPYLINPSPFFYHSILSNNKITKIHYSFCMEYFFNFLTIHNLFLNILKDGKHNTNVNILEFFWGVENDTSVGTSTNDTNIMLIISYISNFFIYFLYVCTKINRHNTSKTTLINNTYYDALSKLINITIEKNENSLIVLNIENINSSIMKVDIFSNIQQKLLIKKNDKSLHTDTYEFIESIRNKKKEKKTNKQIISDNIFCIDNNNTSNKNNIVHNKKSQYMDLICKEYNSNNYYSKYTRYYKNWSWRGKNRLYIYYYNLLLERCRKNYNIYNSNNVSNSSNLFFMKQILYNLPFIIKKDVALFFKKKR